jgi:hypothetical protein
VVAKKLSATASSQHSPFLETDRITPLALARAAKSLLVCWTPAVGMEDHARRRAARRERHRQGVLDELGTHVIAQRPADHAAAGQIDHRRQVGPDLPGHDVRNIVGIAFVRAHAGREVPLDQVPGPFRGRVRDRRGPPPLLAAFQAHSGHQPSDSPLPTAAVAAQGPVDPRCLSP